MSEHIQVRRELRPNFLYKQHFHYLSYIMCKQHLITLQTDWQNKFRSVGEIKPRSSSVSRQEASVFVIAGRRHFT
jgi:hypothetical protein